MINLLVGTSNLIEEARKSVQSEESVKTYSSGRSGTHPVRKEHSRQHTLRKRESNRFPVCCVFCV